MNTCLLRLAGQRARAADRDRARRRHGERTENHAARTADTVEAAASVLPGGSDSAEDAHGRRSESARSSRDRKRLIRRPRHRLEGNITAAAKKLGISRRTLHRKINEMDSCRNEIAENRNTEIEGTEADAAGKWTPSTCRSARGRISDFPFYARRGRPISREQSRPRGGPRGDLDPSRARFVLVVRSGAFLFHA